MLRFITSRFLQSLLALFLVITATFFLVRFVPGGPFTAEKAVTPEILRNLEAHYGLDKPLGQQYLDYLGSLARGDLGPSFKYPNRTVNEIIFDKVPVSAELGSISLAVALVLGIGLGTLAAIRRNTWIDYVASSFGMIGISIPTRGGLLEVLNQDFIRTARAKGASEFRVVTRHALRGGLLPVVSFLGPAVAGILTGSFVIETLFQIPGIGREFVNSAFNRDYTLVLGTVILYAVLIMALNLAVDIAQAWMNPKVRLES